MENYEFYSHATMPHIRKKAIEPILIPEKIGPYRIDTLLHQGVMSHLFLATHPDKNLPIVIKILAPEWIAHPEMVTQFLKEAEIISLADHKNIVKLYDQGRWEKGFYLAMEFIQGVTLRQFILGRTLSLGRILDIILQVSYALLHLHSHGIIHRDLKPENILILENGKIKLIDFGIAQVMGQPDFFPSGAMNTMIGTPSYMSPEQKKDPHHIDVTSDIYSLALIAYEMIIGRASFGQVQLSLLPHHIEPILRKSLEPNPKKRTQDIVEFISQISLYLRTNSLEKDRSEEDTIRETLEILEQEHKKLLPPTTALWKEMEIGLATSKGFNFLGMYYDFFRMPDGSMVVVLAESMKDSILSMTSIATFRGILRTKMHDYTHPRSNEKKFVTSEFLKELNTIFFHEPHKATESVCILHLSPLLNEFCFISSGLNNLWHLPGHGAKPRKLENHSPLLGKEENAEFFSTIDTWNPSDQIVFTSFSEENKPKMESFITSIITKHRNTSAGSFSELLLKQLEKIELKKPPRLALVLTRIQ